MPHRHPSADAPPAPPGRTPGGRIAAWVRLLRPSHWVKNVFVLAPVLFAGALDHVPSVRAAVLMTVSFCALASGTYVLNDLHDRALDRLHPVRRARPLARGDVSAGAAWIVAGALLALGLAGGVLAEARRPLESAARIEALDIPSLCLAYVVLGVLYTLVLKTVVLVDVAALAALFLLRLLAGSAAIDADPSPWMLVCGASLAAFLALGKRRCELVQLGDDAARVRPVLAGYASLGIERLLAAAGVLTALLYVVYCVAPRTHAHVGSYGLLWTVPMVLWGLRRYARQAAAARGSDAVTLLVRDGRFLAAGALWTVVAAAVVHGWW